MTKALTESELAAMDRRFKSMDRKDVIEKARREQAKRVRPVKISQPATKSVPASASAVSRRMVADTKAAEAAGRNPKETPKADAPAFWIDWYVILPAPGGKTVLLRVVGVDGGSIFVKPVRADGEAVAGVPLATLSAASSVKGGWNLFETLADAHAFADSEGLTLVGRT